MNSKALRVLEYNKIIDMLSEQCSSALTKETVAKLVPMTEYSFIREALAETDEAFTVLFKKGAAPLGNFYDISGFVHLAAKGSCLTNRQLLEVSYNLHSANKSASFLSSDLPALPRIDGLASSISVLQTLEDEISRCIISEDQIADSASPELKRLRKAIAKQNEAIKAKVLQIVGSGANQEFLQDSIVTMRQGRYVVPVKQEYRSHVSGIVHDQSASGATLFIEPQAIVDMNNELTKLELDEQKEVRKILEDLSAWVGREELRIKANQEILKKLDFIFAKAKLGIKMNAFKPEINNEGYVRLKKARHPLINAKNVVPIDVELGKGYRTLVITGPNTGGKTVTLKTIGLLSLMAQSGLFIPVSEESTVPIFRDVFADIGDEQSIEQSLSTFSSHMTNIVQIIENARKGALVLLDELGAGTDPTEGAALAIAILEHLYDTGAYTAATTHYTELKKYAISTDGVQNASMEFDVETLSPTYKLIIGVPGKSNAFEISKKLGLSENIIEKSKALLEAGDIAFEDVLESIENDKKAAKAEMEEAVELGNKLREQKARMDALEEKLKQKKQQILEDAKDEARQLVDEARESIASIQKDIDDSKMTAELSKSIADGKRQLSEKRKNYERKEKKTVNYEKPDVSDIQLGIRVNVLSIGEKGTVLSLPDAKGDMMVQVGALKFSVNIEGVTLVKENVKHSAREKTKIAAMFAKKAAMCPTSINVIGENLDSALVIVEKYLDDAYMAGLDTVTIVHGKGSGILRDGIAKMLKSDKHVESFRKGGYYEGQDGATIVTIKK